jgi:F-type H+-transporting ATPase subunit b|nr:ATP synthase CF0 subunit II [Meringosphaera mediterranea]
MQQLIIFLAQEGGPGGLFDIGATLPLVAIQFLILMFLLNTFLYSPLTTHVNDRNAYILENLSRAGDLLLQANQLTTDYKTNLERTSQDVQRESLQSHKAQKELLDAALKSVQQKANLKKIVMEEMHAEDRREYVENGEAYVDFLTQSISYILSPPVK